MDFDTVHLFQLSSSEVDAEVTKLTVNLGLRWEVIPPFYEVTGRMSELDLNAPNPVHGEFIIMRRWASGTTLDNASASGRNPKLGVAQIRQHPVLVDVPSSLHARDEH